MGYHQGHDCCALVHQNKSTHSYISPFFFIHSARCRNFFSAKKWAHFLCITWRSLSLFQITIKDKNKKPWWWKKGGHLMLLDSRPKYNGTFFVCLCNFYTSFPVIEFCGYLIFATFFAHFDVHIVQKSSIKSFLSSSSPKMSKLKLESSKFSSSFVILSESRGRASIAAASQVARNSQNHENHLLYLPDCSTLETWRLWWRRGNTGRTNNFIMNLLCLG